MRESFGESPNLFLERAALNGNVDVDSAGTCGFCVTGYFQGIERVANNQRRLENSFEFCPFNRIEIKLQKIGTVNIVAARVPGIQVNAAKIHNPHERRNVLDHREVDHISRAVLDGTHWNGRRPAGRGALHEEKSTVDAIWIALHDHGAVYQVRHQVRRNVEIILEQVAFG